MCFNESKVSYILKTSNMFIFSEDFVYCIKLFMPKLLTLEIHKG